MDAIPSTRPRSPWLLAGALLLLCSFLFFHRLAVRDLWSSHEGRAAQDAQTLLDEGFGTLPRLFDGRIELQKPPLYYWLVALAAHAGNGRVDALSVRLPAALAGLGGVLGLYYLGLRRGRPVMGFVAAAVLATAVHYTWLSRTGRIDIPLTFTTLLALVGFYLSRQCDETPSAKRLSLVVGYVAVAGGLLLKGPIGAALPLSVASVWLLLRREVPPPWRLRAWLRLAHELGLWWGVLLVLLLVVPCYVWVNVRSGGDFFRVFLWHHNVHRGFGGSELLRAHPWWFYAPRFLADFMPWSVAWPFGAWLLFHRGWWREDAEARFGMSWLLTVFLLLSAMRFKRADYLLPAYPGAALLLGCVAERLWQQAVCPQGRSRPAAGTSSPGPGRRPGPTPRQLAVAFAAALLACAVGWGVYLSAGIDRREPRRELARFAAEVRRWAPPPEPVLFFRTEAHALGFHVGRPLHVFVEWERLDAWAAQPESCYVVMPAAVAREWPQFLRSGRLEEVLRNTDLPGAADHEKPLVLLRTRPTP